MTASQLRWHFINMAASLRVSSKGVWLSSEAKILLLAPDALQTHSNCWRFFIAYFICYQVEQVLAILKYNCIKKSVRTVSTGDVFVSMHNWIP